MITSENFSNDVVSNNINVVPLIVFTKGDATIAISTQNTLFKDTNQAPLYFPPLLLNIPSIRESVDIESRIFKISNISLTVSNVEYKGSSRFSDSIADVMNSDCKVYWKTQSANNLDECLLVYQGKVRRVSHTDTTATVVVEDVSQENLHKDIPIARVSTDIEILDKYKNEPIPICYGEVNKAKVVLTPSNDGTDNIDALADDVGNKTIFGHKEDSKALIVRYSDRNMYVKKD